MLCSLLGMPWGRRHCWASTLFSLLYEIRPNKKIEKSSVYCKMAGTDDTIQVDSIIAWFSVRINKFKKKLWERQWSIAWILGRALGWYCHHFPLYMTKRNKRLRTQRKDTTVVLYVTSVCTSMLWFTVDPTLFNP